MVDRMKYPNVFLCLLIGFAGAFKVNTSIHVVGVYGSPAVLGCTYSPTTGTALGDLIITWQRVRDSAVVHSFYSGQDQLSKQDSAYHGRTSLFHSELLTGNISLRLDGISFNDEDHYLCSVSSNQGSDKAEVRLNFTAFYTEPHFFIEMLPRKLKLSYKSRGYPMSEVLWTDAEGREISDAKVSISKVEQGLIDLHTFLTVDQYRELTYTFTMRNRPLGQVIQRHVTFRNGAGEYHKDCPFRRWIYIVFVLLLLD